MKVILLGDIRTIGKKHDVKEVSDGYARNFLLPQGKARRVTPENLALFEAKRADLEKVQAEQLTAAQEKAAKLQGLMLQITRKSGVDGRLFGSVTTADIAEALKTQGFEVEKTDIRLPDGPLKQIGDNQIDVALHTDVVATITVSVLGEH